MTRVTSDRNVLLRFQVPVPFGQVHLPVPAAVQPHVHRRRTVLLSDVRVPLFAAAATAQRHRNVGAQGRASTVEMLGHTRGRPTGRPFGHTRVQRLRHP